MSAAEQAGHAPHLTPPELRREIRAARWTTHTSGCCPGHLQLNVVMLPAAVAQHFQSFCEQNKLACPLIHTLPAGERALPPHLARDADIATDIPRYRVYRHGKLVEEREHVRDLFRGDLVTFLLGCSFSFESLLVSRSIPVRNVEQRKNVSMYRTSTPCLAAGPFQTNLVVSMRPVPRSRVQDVYALTGDRSAIHGPPVHHGDPAHIGIGDLATPDFGDAVEHHDDDVPLFWPCGVTAIMGAISAACDLTITHSPGHMFVCDCLESDV